jgi:hypothetical protein
MSCLCTFNFNVLHSYLPVLVACFIELTLCLVSCAGKPNVIELNKDSLHMNLRKNNTLEVTAALDIAVTAKTWVGTGIYFGALGCLRFSLCSARDVVYSAHVDIKVEIQGKSELNSYASIFKLA